jgi:REP element-mobilizing transposase RayT
MAKIITEYPHFFTATILEWKKLLKPDKYKDIIVNSMKFLVSRQRVIIYGFVIMINHIHIVWQMKAGISRSNLQRDFLKFTAQKIKRDLSKNHPQVLDCFFVDAKDRAYQFWERNPPSVEIWSEKVLEQKLKYLHENPVRAELCRFPGEYKYSSALFYKKGVDNWGFLTHYRD